MACLKRILFVLFLCSAAKAETLKYVYNPQTGRLDYISVISTTTITPFVALKSSSVAFGSSTNLITSDSTNFNWDASAPGLCLGCTSTVTQRLRAVSTSSMGPFTFEMPTNNNIFLELINDTAGLNPVFYLEQVGSGGDSFSGASSGDSQITASNKLYLRAGGVTANANIKLDSTGNVIFPQSTNNQIFFSSNGYVVGNSSFSYSYGTGQAQIGNGPFTYKFNIYGTANNTTDASLFVKNPTDGTAASAILNFQAGTSGSASGYFGAFPAAYTGISQFAQRVGMSTNSDAIGMFFSALTSGQNIIFYPDSGAQILNSNQASLYSTLGVYNNLSNGLTAKNKGSCINMGTNAAGYFSKVCGVFESQNPDFLNPGISFWTMNESVGPGTEVERMRISSTGNIGIGTASPATKLHLSSGVFTVDGSGDGVNINGPLTVNNGQAAFYVNSGSITAMGSTSANYSAYVTTSTTSGWFHLAVSTSGHVLTNGPTPTISACGAAPAGSVVGDDNSGTITVGAGVVTSCTLTFAKTWGTMPVCVISDNSVAVTGDISSLSATAMTASFSASLGGGLIYYRCSCSGSSCL